MSKRTVDSWKINYKWLVYKKSCTLTGPQDNANSNYSGIPFTATRFANIKRPANTIRW